MNPRTFRTTTLLTIIAVASAAAEPGSAQAQTLNPISQSRSVDTLALANQCQQKTFDSEVAPGFAPFDGLAISEVACNADFSFAQALQQSQINSTSLTGFGDALSSVTSGAQDLVIALTNSLYRVTFELDSASHFTLFGHLVASAATPDNQFFANASFELTTGPKNQVIISHAVTTTPKNPQPGKVIISQSGVLDPGVYTLTAHANTVFDSDTSPGGAGEGEFGFTFQLVACSTDLNGDGVTNGSDLAAMLAQWGAAGAADLNADGVVNGADLAQLLTNWGLCNTQ